VSSQTSINNVADRTTSSARIWNCWSHHYASSQFLPGQSSQRTYIRLQC
jgi:hypothetical protein